MIESQQLGMRWVYVTLIAYGAGLSLFWPRVFLVVDEERYVTQALALSRGARTIADAGIIFPPQQAVISDYPPGTALLQTPFVWALGWRAAVLLSVLSLVIATLVTARWLRESGRSPAFALLIPGFLGASLFGRIAMSDLPATALVAVGCWALWRSQGRATMSLLAGFSSGLVLLFREPPVVLLAILLAGAALRGAVAIWPALVGFAMGAALRFGANALLFGDLFHVRDAGYGFSLASLRHSVPVYGFLLLVMFPAGALLPLAYRAARRGELVAAIVAYVGLFLLFEYDSVAESGLLKGLLNASRYMAPALPLLAFMAGAVWPGVHDSLRSRWSATRVLPFALGCAAVAIAVAVHPLARRQEAVSLAIVRAFYDHTRADAPVITNSDATLKYFSPAYGPRQLILRYGLPADSVAAFARRFETLNVAFLDRSDGESYRRDADGNEQFLDAVRRRCAVHSAYAEQVAPWARLRVFAVRDCR